jgi:predicted component of type VI protein secretion system
MLRVLFLAQTMQSALVYSPAGVGRFPPREQVSASSRARRQVLSANNPAKMEWIAVARRVAEESADPAPHCEQAPAAAHGPDEAGENCRGHGLL